MFDFGFFMKLFTPKVVAPVKPEGLHFYESMNWDIANGGDIDKPRLSGNHVGMISIREYYTQSYEGIKGMGVSMVEFDDLLFKERMAKDDQLYLQQIKEYKNSTGL